MIPFVLVHLILFFTMPWPLALASVLLATVISVPFAYLFELGGHTIWPPALLHTIIQGTVKVVVVPDDRMMPLALMWMLASAVIPLIARIALRPRDFYVSSARDALADDHGAADRAGDPGAGSEHSAGMRRIAARREAARAVAGPCSRRGLYSESQSDEAPRRGTRPPH